MFNINNKSNEPIELSDVINAFSDEGFDSAVNKALQTAKQSERNSILSVTVPYENIDPLAVLEILGKDEEFQYYWEHPDEKLALAAGRSLIKLRADGNNRFDTMANAINHVKSSLVEYSKFGHSLAGVHFLGGFSFFDEVSAPEWNRFGAACFVLPEWIFIRDGELSLLTINFQTGADDQPDSIHEKVSSRFFTMSTRLQHATKHKNGDRNNQASTHLNILEDESAAGDWKAYLNKAKSRIIDGEFDKIVLSRQLLVETGGKIHPTRVLNNLRREYPSCYSFMFRPDGNDAFIGSTPERLLSIRSNYVLTEGLAGSISRGKSATEDTILEKQLLNSSKDLEEHLYVVQEVVSRLQQYSDQVNFHQKPGIKKFTNVQHLFTPISAWLKKSYDPIHILGSLHPTPAVGGFPTDKTVSHIHDFEDYDRGWYAGPVGWLNSKGRGEFVVSIRSGLVNDNQANIFAGCGIVSHSDPEAEWEETKLKFIPMLSAINHG